MKLTEDQETSTLVASRAATRAANALAEAQRTDELALYMTNRAKWIEQTAPRTAALIARWGDAEAIQTWEMIGRDYQCEVWKYLDAEQRERLKRLRKAAA